MNPVILRGIRERLRIKHLIAAGLFSLIVSATIYFTAYLNEANGGWSYNPQTGQMEQNEPSSGSRGPSRLPFSFVPARFLSNVSRNRPGCRHHRRGEGVRTLGLPTHDSDESILKNMGISIGFASQRILYVRSDPALSPSLHHSRGTWLLRTFLHLYFVFFSSVVLYHLTAHVIGLVVPKPRAASWVSGSSCSDFTPSSRLRPRASPFSPS